MKTVAILGRKGGSGKSTLAYFLAHGMSTGVSELVGSNIWSVLLRTDNRTRRPSELNKKRKYMVASVPGDENDGDYIKTLIEQIGHIPDSFLIIDGGANRRNYDYAACAVADLVLIPTGCSEEDLETADGDYDDLMEFIEANERPAEVFFVRNKWPGVTRKYESLMAKPWVKKYLKKWEKSGVLFPHIIPDMPSFMDLANADEPQATLLLNKLSMSFAQVIASRIELPAMMEYQSRDAYRTAAE
jgi:hypothetical protein